ncbi:phenylalanine--tRNA ligase subunit alpha [Halapricum desulfuricans]|uniref:Phenylalanine--tRNA ligase alpha subunit n=1 Tax=Halapricum desulfuricans TaxID=2841257 RepID=A0A897N870_9EURY|nr:phenylalanine--tRNA ligase subunit alpha [Halapricum desulfuricans]QSG07375.1 Phenylalanyl-tRNA synthetase alpha subunit [Halapricum desulfuricans]
MKLPETQVAVVEAASATEARTVESLADELDHKPESITRAVFELEDSGLLDVLESTEESVSLTDEGRTYLEDGLPEIRLYEAALETADGDPVEMGEVIGASGLEGGAVDIALSNLARKGYGEIDSGEISPDPDADPDADEEVTALEAIESGDADLVAEDTLDQLERRGLIERSEWTVRSVQLTDEGVTALMEGIEVAEAVDRLTSELLTSGEWRDAEFSEYNVAADAPEIDGGKHHPLRAMAERVKDVLVGMGFEEMQGPHADAEFWINDCLFMPQDHPARTHWDQFALDVPPMGELPDGVRERVEGAHREGVGEDGEGYHSPWGEEMARQIDLRGHTTSLSARYLSGIAEGDLEPPQRYFSIEKAYRNDEIDATHLLEFFQIEGWVMAEDLSVRDLMGTFTEFYEQFGITDLQFKPTYNPYTEPSFELFGEHPVTGEVVEIGNSGIFRPEMLEPLGVDCDVMAWGLALERLMMLVTGAEDIRDVHGTLVDLDYLRTEEVRY